MAEHLDLDELEKVARVALDPPFPVIEAQFQFARAFTPEVVLKLIALARLNPPAASGGQQNQGVMAYSGGGTASAATPQHGSNEPASPLVRGGE